MLQSTGFILPASFTLVVDRITSILQQVSCWSQGKSNTWVWSRMTKQCLLGVSRLCQHLVVILKSEIDVYRLGNGLLLFSLRGGFRAARAYKNRPRSRQTRQQCNTLLSKVRLSRSKRPSLSLMFSRRIAQGHSARHQNSLVCCLSRETKMMSIVVQEDYAFR